MTSYLSFRAAPMSTAVAVAILLSGSFANGQEPIAQGLHDVVVYDPGTHERGLPAVQFNPSGEGMRVDIPPAVHVHRYYYSGDKEIQGPLINGGPTVVVANHPKTGQRMYIDVMLPGGAPKIAYNKHSITYVYRNERVAVNFSKLAFAPDRVNVEYKRGQGFARTAYANRQRLAAGFRQRLKESPVAQSIKTTSQEATDLLRGAADSLGASSASLGDQLRNSLNLIPGMTYLRSRGEQLPERRYLNEIEAAQRNKERNAVNFLRTIR